MQQKYFPLELKIPSKGNSSCLEPSPPADRVIKIYILLNKPSPLKFHATFRIASYILTSLPEIHRAAKPIRKFPSKTPIAERKKKKKKKTEEKPLAASERKRCVQLLATSAAEKRRSCLEFSSRLIINRARVGSLVFLTRARVMCVPPKISRVGKYKYMHQEVCAINQSAVVAGILKRDCVISGGGVIYWYWCLDATFLK